MTKITVIDKTTGQPKTMKPSYARILLKLNKVRSVDRCPAKMPTCALESESTTDLDKSKIKKEKKPNEQDA
jgi:hypothetical protein